MLLIHHLVERRKQEDGIGCLLEIEAAEQIANEDKEKTRNELSVRVALRMVLLFLPLLAFSPLILMFYLVEPRKTLFYIWILLAGRPKSD